MACPLGYFSTDNSTACAACPGGKFGATPAGGFGPYTYAWTLVTNGGGTASVAVNPSNATTSFSKPNVAVGQAFTDTWRVTVTDSTGDTATDDVSVTFSNLSTGGGFE